MILKEYLKLRGNQSLSKKEALVIGLSWPLERNWNNLFARREIGKTAFDELRKICEQHGGVNAFKGRKNVTEVAKHFDCFYDSPEWKAIRYKALSVYGNCCHVCGRGPKDGVIIHVDHIVPRSKDKSKELELENLQVMCSDCNLGKSNFDSVDWR